MAQAGYTPIQLYYSTTAAAVPLAANLAQGELAINIADGKLYYENSSGVVTLLASSTTVTNSFSAGTTGFTPSTATTGAVTLGGTLITSNGGTGLSSYTAGDLSYYASGTALTKLAIGTAGQFLTSTGTAPQWSTLSGVAVTTFSAGTTGFTPNTATSGAITLAGTLATTNGGTGLTSFTSGGVVYASSTSALATGTALTYNGSTFVVAGTDATRVAGFSGTTKGVRIETTATETSISGVDSTLIGSFQPLNLNGSYVSFSTSQTERMRLSSSGLYIGTGGVTAGYPLDVRGGATEIIGNFTTTGSTAYTPSAYNGNKARIFLSSGNATGATNGFEFTAGGSNECYFGTVQESGGGGAFVFQGYNPVNSSYFERMRITTESYLGLLGYTTPNNAIDFGQSSAGYGISWGNYANVFGEYSSGATYLSSNYYPTPGAAGYKTSVTGTYGAAGVSISGTGGASTDGVILFYANPATAKTAGVAFNPTERMRIVGNTGNVGIGTNNPIKLFTVNSATNDVEVLRINVNGGAGGVQGKGDIGFGFYDTVDEASAAIGFEEYLTSSAGGNLLFKTRPDGAAVSTRPTERMRISEAGLVGIGTNSPASTLQVGVGGPRETTASFFGTGSQVASSISTVGIYSTNTATVGVGAALTLGGQTGNAVGTYPFGIIQGAKNNATAGDYGGYLQFNTIPANGGSPIPNLTLTTGGGVQAYNTISVGNATPSTSGAGITFPATQSASSDANTLDDYEEGTWTPSIGGSSVQGTGTYTTQQGTYTKIGNSVRFQAYIVWTAHTGVGQLEVLNYPFASTAETTPLSLSFYGGVTFVSGNFVQAYKNPNGITSGTAQTSAVSVFTSVGVPSTGEYFVSGIYKVA
jgi:hypothetical protein